MKKLRAAIIGLGVGERHIDGYARCPEVELAALCDFSEAKLKEVGARYPGLHLVKSAEEILDDPCIDVVSIATYDNHHFAQVSRAIRQGKHVFVEKPLCLHETEAVEIRKLLDENPKVRLSSNLILRQSPRFKLLREWIRSGKLGRLFHLEGDYEYGRLEKLTQGWRGKLDFYSVVHGGAVHVIDLLLWLTGDEVVEVTAYGNDFCTRGSPFRHNDFVAALLKFRSGLVGKVTVNFGCVHPHYHDVKVYGTQATFVNGMKEGLLFESRDPNVAPKTVDAVYPGIDKGGLIASFIGSIFGDGPPEVSAEDVFRVMSVCFAVEESARRNAPVTVDYISGRADHEKHSIRQAHSRR